MHSQRDTPEEKTGRVNKVQGSALRCVEKLKHVKTVWSQKPAPETCTTPNIK